MQYNKAWKMLYFDNANAGSGRNLEIFTYIYFYYIFKDEKCFDSMICLHNQISWITY